MPLRPSYYSETSAKAQSKCRSPLSTGIPLWCPTRIARLTKYNGLTRHDARPPFTGVFAMTGCDPWIGKRLGKYAIVRALGRGAMGVVYEAEDTRLQRPVALKLLPESLARDEALVKRFLLEARAAARLSHPNVVAVYDIGQRDGTYYLALELVRGVNLKQVLATRGPLPWA